MREMMKFWKIEGADVYEATSEGVTYRIRRVAGAWRAYRVIDGTIEHPAAAGGPHADVRTARLQCEEDLDDVLRDRRAEQTVGRKLRGPIRAHLDAPCTEACYEPAAAESDPAATDDQQELMDRVVRRAQYLALQAVLTQLDIQHAAQFSGQRCSAPAWSCGDIRQMVNGAARALGTAQPYRVAP